MITFRPFRNTDPPQIAEIWRSQPASRGLAQPMSPALFERFVLSASMFDREGLIVAADDERLLGFAHAGFGPSEDEQHLVTEIGATCALMVRPVDDAPLLAEQLLARSEQYLKSRGSTVLLAGGVSKLGPFYLGLNGGSACSGILNSDADYGRFLVAHGYRGESRAIVMHCDLAHFRPAVDRRQMLIRRSTAIRATPDPVSPTWWEAATFGVCDRTRFDLMSRSGDTQLASVMLWNMDLLSTTWGVRAAGLVDLEVSLDINRRHGLALHLVAEAMRHVHSQGVMLIEAQVQATNAPARSLFERLGFIEVDQAVRFRKDVAEGGSRKSEVGS